jgi:hypothetical protein
MRPPFLRLRLFVMYLFMAVYAIFQPDAAARVLTDADEAERERERRDYIAGLTKLCQRGREPA